MISKQENIQFIENIPQCLACKIMDSSSYASADAFLPEDSFIKTEHDNNVIPSKLKTSRKVNTGKSEISENALVNAKVVQGLIVKQVLKKGYQI